MAGIQTKTGQRTQRGYCTYEQCDWPEEMILYLEEGLIDWELLRYCFEIIKTDIEDKRTE